MHLFCADCVIQYADNQIGLNKYQIPCMDINDSCSGITIDGDTLFYTSLTEKSKEVLDILEKKQKKLASLAQTEQINAANIQHLERCPACNDNPLIIEETFAEIPDFPCNDCGPICRQCKQPSHPGTVCPEIKQNFKHWIEEKMTAALVRKCPKLGCDTPIIKAPHDGCNHMKCPTSGCKGHMCYLCRKDITEERFAHFHNSNCEAFDFALPEGYYEREVENARNEAINQLLAENPGLREEDLDDIPKVNHSIRENPGFHNNPIIPDHREILEEFNDNYFDNQQPVVPQNSS